MVVAALDGEATRPHRFRGAAAPPKPGIRSRDRVGRRIPKAWLGSLGRPEHADDGSGRQRYHENPMFVANRPTTHLG